jgi:hypothetical protein
MRGIRNTGLDKVCVTEQVSPGQSPPPPGKFDPSSCITHDVLVLLSIKSCQVNCEADFVLYIYDSLIGCDAPDIRLPEMLPDYPAFFLNLVQVPLSGWIPGLMAGYRILQIA